MRACVVLLVSVVLVSCRSSAPAARPAPGAPRVTMPADSLLGPWRFGATAQPRAQRIAVSAELTSVIGTTLQSDSLSTTSLVEWAVNPSSTPLRVAGSVREFSVRTTVDSVWRALVPAGTVVSFVADQPHALGVPELQTPRSADCSLQAAVVEGWRETWVGAPSEVSRGSSWRDSSESTSCRDGIVLRATVVRVFTVDGAVVEDGRLRVLLRRVTTTRVRGSGLQFGDSVTIEGEGRGEATLEVLPGSAIIAEGKGSGLLSLTLRGRRRTQELVQHSALVISQP